MIKNPQNKYSSNYKHASYGIVNWFASKGIKNEEIIQECLYMFMESFVGKVKPNTPEHIIINFAQNRFSKFAYFATNYLKENNYL